MLLAQQDFSALTELTIALTSVTLVTTAILELPQPTSPLTCVLWVITALKEPSSLRNALTVNSQREELAVKQDVHSVTQGTTVFVKLLSLTKLSAPLVTTAQKEKCTLDLVLKELLTLGKREMQLESVRLVPQELIATKLESQGTRTTCALLASTAPKRHSLL